MNKRTWILDASALLSGMDLSPFVSQRAVTTPSVIDEVSKGRSARDRDTLLGMGLEVKEPTAGSLETVRAKAKETGDAIRLSSTDMELLALALDLKGTLVSDDYSIQNVAKAMGIQWQPLAQKGISEQFTWKYRCTGCRRIMDDPVDECPVCGHGVKSHRPRKK